MVFSSSIFIFVFLPVVLLCYYLLNRQLKNLFLLAASLVFYAWGEMFYVLIMLGSISTHILVTAIRNMEFRDNGMTTESLVQTAIHNSR